jgi:glucokinase
MIFGGAKGMKDFVFITLGTGLGSGIVANGELIYGHDSFAGEIGHVIMFPDGRQCGCGRKGCLETYCSATGIKRTYSDLLMSTHEKVNLKDKVADAKYIYEKALEGEKSAVEAFNYTGDILGLALANSVAYTSPEAIFLFGGLAQAGDFIFKPTKESMERNLLNIYKNKIKLLPSQLKENDAAILGAASLIWKEIK